MKHTNCSETMSIGDAAGLASLLPPLDNFINTPQQFFGRVCVCVSVLFSLLSPLDWDPLIYTLRSYDVCNVLKKRF